MTIAPPLTRLAEGVRTRLFYGYWLVFAAFVAQFVSVGAQNYSAGVFLKPMTEDLGWSRGDFTWPRTIGQFVIALTGLFIGSHVDHRGGRRVMVVGTSVLVGALWATSYVDQLWQFMLLNGLALTAGAAMMGNLVVNVTLAKWFVERRGMMVGLGAMGISFAGIVVPPLLTGVVDEWGWRAGWKTLAVAALVLMVPIIPLMRRTPEDHGLRPDGGAVSADPRRAARAAADFASSLTRAEAVRSPIFYLMVLAFGLFSVSIGVLLIQSIPFMTDAGYSRSTASLMITVSSIPALLSKPVWGFLLDRVDPKRLVCASALLTGTAIAWIVAAVHGPGGVQVPLAFIVLGLGWGGMLPLQEVTWASYFGRRHLGAVRSAALPFSLLLGAAAPQLTSIYYDQVGNYDGAFLTVAGCCLVAAVLMLFVRRPRRAEAFRSAG
jgi:MFS family permease